MPNSRYAGSVTTKIASCRGATPGAPMAKLLLNEILLFSCVGVFFVGTVLGAAHLLAN